MYTEKLLREEHIPFRKHVPLAPLCSMRVGGAADILLCPECPEDVCRWVSVLLKHGIPFYPVGAMTNLLPPDGDVHRVLLSTRALKSVKVFDDVAVLGAGCVVGAVAAGFALKNRDVLSGLSTVPGTVGGAVRGNAGAFGAECADTFLYADVLRTDNGHVERVDKDGMNFGYRTSSVKSPGYIVLSAAFCAPPADGKSLRHRMSETRALRLRSQPITYPSLGSIFLRSDDGVPAAARIDACGLKGMRIGGAAVSVRHAGFIVNVCGASSSDVCHLIHYIQHRVKSTCGVLLRPEIEFLPRG